MNGYLGPYRGERYHLHEFRQARRPSGKEEIFNHMHSSLRSIIERTFGVWKKKWDILRDMPKYPFDKQVLIVNATMVLHNYIRRHAGSNDEDFQEFENMPDMPTSRRRSDMDESSHHGDGQIKMLRESIAMSLMNSR